MLVINYAPGTGWSAPEIKPYGPLSLDPMSSCFQYCPNVFEGMKVRRPLIPLRNYHSHIVTAVRRISDQMENLDCSDQRIIWSVLFDLPPVWLYP